MKASEIDLHLISKSEEFKEMDEIVVENIGGIDQMRIAFLSKCFSNVTARNMCLFGFFHAKAFCMKIAGELESTNQLNMRYYSSPRAMSVSGDFISPAVPTKPGSAYNASLPVKAMSTAGSGIGSALGALLAAQMHGNPVKVGGSYQNRSIGLTLDDILQILDLDMDKDLTSKIFEKIDELVSSNYSYNHQQCTWATGAAGIRQNQFYYGNISGNTSDIYTSDSSK